MPRPPLRLRSQRTILLLLILREAPAPSHYISFHLGLEPSTVSKYLSLLKQYGLADYDEYGIWHLTDKGHEYIDAHLQSLINLKNNKRMGELVRFAKEIQRNSNLFQEIQGYGSVVDRARELIGRELSSVEKALLQYLASFSGKTGRKYWWPPEPVPLQYALAEELERSSGMAVTPSEVERALRELEAAGVLFLTYDRRRGVQKVRISRNIY